MDKIISLKDIESIEDKVQVEEIKNHIFSRMNGGVKRTRIIMKNLETGETKELHNKVVISGSVATASSLFIIDPPVEIPTYNTALGLEKSVETIPINKPLICLFGVGDDGCGILDSDVFTPNYVDRIPPEKLYPFRYIGPGKSDISASEREIYYGRKVDGSTGAISYYFKAFNNDPQLYLRYTDGTEIVPSTMYNVVTTQDAECYVQLDLSINRLDFREYFDVIGWDKARISSLSLVYAWYTEDGGYKWYQDIIPFTKLNFSYEKLVDSTKALAFEYSLFF